MGRLRWSARRRQAENGSNYGKHTNANFICTANFRLNNKNRKTRLALSSFICRRKAAFGKIEAAFIRGQQ
jgi:hypothetical protein